MTDIEQDIPEIAYSIWETLFSFPLAPAEAGSPPTQGSGGLTGCVQIDGAWNGAVLLECPTALARQLAGELFRTAGETTAEEVRDTIGELTNMLAGNIKALLPEPSRISLPAVAEGGDYDLRIMGTEPVGRVAFSCAGEVLVVTLLERLTESGG